jgi:hypothetical protein
VVEGMMMFMSDEGHEPTDKHDDSSEPESDVNDKLARIGRGFDAGKSDKISRLFATKPSPAIERLLSMQHDMESLIPKMPEVPIMPSYDIPDPKTMPAYRAAHAAEQTAEHMKVLVDEAVENRVRAAETERRETVMLRWTIAGVSLAAIAAIASIVAILVSL